MNKRLQRLLAPFLILVSVSCGKEGDDSDKKLSYIPDWKTAADVANNLEWAAANEKCYHSHFHFYEPRIGKEGSISELMNQGARLNLQHNPAINGLDFFYASGTWFEKDYISQNRANMLKIAKEAWRTQKTVPSFSWHLENPYVSSDFTNSMGCRYRATESGDVPGYPTEHRYVIHEILQGTGGKCGYGNKSGVDNTAVYDNPRVWFEDRCKEVAGIIKELVDDEGKPIPMLLRLWHELEDDWHWWGPYSVSANDYKEFWKLTRQLIYKYAPNAQILWVYCTDFISAGGSTYLQRYPGDDVVDIMGYDDYHIGENDASQKLAVSRAKNVSYFANKHNKICGIFETNLKNVGAWLDKGNGIKDPDDPDRKTWFRQRLLKEIILAPGVDFGIVQCWGFYNDELSNPALIADRKAFYEDEHIIMYN